MHKKTLVLWRVPYSNAACSSLHCDAVFSLLPEEGSKQVRYTTAVKKQSFSSFLYDLFTKYEARFDIIETMELLQEVLA